MVHRPWSITALAIILGSVTPIVFIQWLRQKGFVTLTDLTPLQIYLAVLTVASSVVAVGVWRVRLWGYYAFLVLCCGVLGYMFYEYLNAADTERYMSIMVSALFAFGSGVLLQKHVSAPYFNPRLRWWERNPRYRVQLGVKFQVDRQTRKGSLLDISRGGCFAELDGKLIVGEEIEMRMQLLKFDFTTRAKVIWHSEDPKGYGLMFVGITGRHKQEIDNIIQYLIESQGENGPLVNQGIRPAA